MRFVGQGYEISVNIPSRTYRPEDVADLRDAFFGSYSETYGDRSFSRADSIEFVHFRVAASVSLASAAVETIASGGGDPSSARRGRRPVYFPETNGFVPCDVFDRYGLKDGDIIDGPAIIEERESTVVLIPDSRARVDQAGNIIVDLY